MKKIIYFLLLAGIVSVFSLQCKNPLQDVKLEVNAEVINYSVLLEFDDPCGCVPKGLSVNVKGKDAAAIYDLSGKKEIAIDKGIIAIGVHPRMEPTDGNPLSFNIEVSGDGYLPLNIPVKIYKKQFQQIMTKSIMKISTPPAGASVRNTTTNLNANSSISQPVTLSTPLTNGKTEAATITLPAGTQFQDADGKVLTGSTLKLLMAHFDTKHQESLNLFPGGSFTASDVTGPGNQQISATLIPASFASVDLTLGNTAVRRFSQPITIAMQIDPAYQNLQTNAAIKAGDKLSVFSFEVGEGKWKYEQDVDVTLVNGKLSASFQTNHLTWFTIGQYATACAEGLTLEFQAPWLGESQLPVTVKAEIVGFDSYAIDQKQITVSNGSSDIFTNLPNKPVKFTFFDDKGKVIGETEVSNPCSVGKVVATLASPETQLPEVSMKLTVRCPEQNVVVTPPDFYFYYREAKSASDPSGYKILGLVKKGEFKTNLLKTDVEYDFKAVWGSRTKIVYKKKVSLNNSTEVGTGNTGNDKRNLDILIEECNSRL